MEIVGGGINGNYLRNYLLNAPDDIAWVKAAVAYANVSEELLGFCVNNKLPFTFYGRMDSTVPVETRLLEKFLKLGPIFQCKLVLDYFHPKVIWFEGYGAYIGSANLTSRAWYDNIEYGVWFNSDELIKFGVVDELNELFSKVDSVSEVLTNELLVKIREAENNRQNSGLEKTRQGLELSFKNNIGPLLSKNFSGLTRFSKKDAKTKRKMNFMAEWTSTLTLLRKMATEVVKDENRPKWVSKEAPSGVQVDQFLHAYYYSEIKPGQKSKHEEFHLVNQSNTEVAIEKAMKWWAGLEKPVDEEDIFINEKAPFIFDHLKKSKLLDLTVEEFTEVLSRINAFRTAARQTTNDELDLEAGTKLKIEDRIRMVTEWLFEQRAPNGTGPKEVLFYVLYGGAKENITDRIWNAAFGENWHIPRMGLSTIGEIVGWAAPDSFPPRNGRTSKALYALGYDVTLYS